MSSTEPANTFPEPEQSAPAPAPTPVTSPDTSMIDVPLGTLIFRAGLLGEEQLEGALQEGMRTGKRLGEVLLERGWLNERDLGRMLAGQKGLPFVDVNLSDVEHEALAALTEEDARRQVALPLFYEDGELVIAVGDPSNEVALEGLRRELEADFQLVVAPYSQLQQVIDEAYTRPAPARSCARARGRALPRSRAAREGRGSGRGSARACVRAGARARGRGTSPISGLPPRSSPSPRTWRPPRLRRPRSPRLRNRFRARRRRCSRGCSSRACGTPSRSPSQPWTSKRQMSLSPRRLPRQTPRSLPEADAPEPPEASAPVEDFAELEVPAIPEMPVPSFEQPAEGWSPRLTRSRRNLRPSTLPTSPPSSRRQVAEEPAAQVAEEPAEQVAEEPACRAGCRAGSRASS